MLILIIIVTIYLITLHQKTYVETYINDYLAGARKIHYYIRDIFLFELSNQYFMKL